jgi:E3 ubiquitin-protein ligase HUWE1
MVAFKKHGGLHKLSNLLTAFRQEICKDHSDEVDAPLARLAEIGMKKILELYSLMVTGKVIGESVAQVNLLPRTSTSDRRAESQVAPNLVVELRMAILPVMRELWDSPLIEKGSSLTVTKILTILKAIVTADHENNAYQKGDKVRSILPRLIPLLVLFTSLATEGTPKLGVAN